MSKKKETTNTRIATATLKKLQKHVEKEQLSMVGFVTKAVEEKLERESKK